MAKKHSSTNQLKKFISQRRSYLTGIFLGLTLILVNTVIGLYLVNLVLTSGSDAEVTDVETLPVPKINEDEYNTFKDDYTNRLSKELITVQGKDPFGTH